MKIFFISMLFLSNMVLMCAKETQVKNSQIDAVNNAVSKKIKKEETHQKSADYSDLFKLNSPICLSVDEISQATGLPANSIEIKTMEHSKFSCHYSIKLPNNEKLDFFYYATKLGKQDVNKEIKKFLKDKKSGINIKITKTDIELSKTGDCYITHQKMHGRSMIMNPNYDNVIFSSWINKTYNLDDKQTEARMKIATDILNFLIKKYRK